ncbi:MAG: G1 family glutamic endopeptidase [Acidimicrobiales bacterium]
MRRIAAAVIALLAMSALVVGVGGISTTQVAAAVHSGPVANGVLVRKDGYRMLPRHGGTVSSVNWAGYAVTPADRGITAVNSIFIVPPANLLPPGFSATWTGIGGYNGPDLIQAGVAEQSLPSLPFIGEQYFAWYELLPGSEMQLTGCTGDPNCTVSPGNTVGVYIHQIGPSLWSIAMADAHHWTWSRTVTYRSSNSSAEWILEAPSVVAAQTLMAPVGIVSFGATSTFTVGAKTYTLAEGHPTRIDLSLGAFDEATPSAIMSRNGQSFNVCSYSQSCPAP